MKETQTIGGSQIEAKGLSCLSNVKVEPTEDLKMDDMRIDLLIPAIRRALEIAGDSVDSWLKDAVSTNDSGVTISLHLIWSDLPPELFKVKSYVTEEEFLQRCKEVEQVLKEPI